MKTAACSLLAMVLACLSVRAEDTAGTSETQMVGTRMETFRDVGPQRSVLVGFEVSSGKYFNIECVDGIRPIFLDAEGHEQLGSLRGREGGRPVRVKAKKGYAVGAISVIAGTYVQGLSVTFMKLERGRLNPNRSYDSDWFGGGGGDASTRVGGSGEVAVGLFGSQNRNNVNINLSPLNGLGLVLSNKPIVVAAPQKRSPPPDEAAQAKALKLAKEVYGESWTAAKTATQKRELAQKLLQGADENENDPTSRYILLKLARDVAAQAGDGMLAFDAIDGMAEQFQVDDVDMKTSVLTALSKRAKSQADHKALGEESVGLIDGAVAHDNIDLAVKLCELALPEARASRDPDLLREVRVRSEQCKALAKACQEMKDAAAVLDKKPDDAAANLTVGKYYCFQAGNWEKGLPMLALGQDKTLRDLAAREIAGITKAGDQVKAGDAWWDLAEKEQGRARVSLGGRANYWYQQALPAASGLAKQKLEKRIKDYEAASEGAEKTEGTAAAKRAAKNLPGLVGQYYNDSLFRQMVAARVDLTVDFNWGFNPPEPNVNAQSYAVRWLGYVKATNAGRYAIRVRGHNDCQVAIDNAVVITPVRTTRGVATTQQAEVNLTAGYHPVAVQFVYSFGLPANINLSWQPPGTAGWTAIPQQCLFHDQRQEQAAGIGGVSAAQIPARKPQRLDGVKNGIILIEYIGQLRAEGSGLHEALIHAGRIRFRHLDDQPGHDPGTAAAGLRLWSRCPDATSAGDRRDRQPDGQHARHAALPAGMDY